MPIEFCIVYHIFDPLLELYVRETRDVVEGYPSHLYVRYTEIMEGTDQIVLHGLFQPDLVSDVVMEETIDVETVGTIGCGRHPGQETGFEIVHDGLVCGGTDVMDLVDHDVVETVPRDPSVDLRIGHGLHRGEYVVFIRTPLGTVILRHGGPGTEDPPETLE